MKITSPITNVLFQNILALIFFFIFILFNTFTKLYTDQPLASKKKLAISFNAVVNYFRKVIQRQRETKHPMYSFITMKHDLRDS